MLKVWSGKFIEYGITKPKTETDAEDFSVIGIEFPAVIESVKSWVRVMDWFISFDTVSPKFKEIVSGFPNAVVPCHSWNVMLTPLGIKPAEGKVTVRVVVNVNVVLSDDNATVGVVIS